MTVLQSVITTLVFFLMPAGTTLYDGSLAAVVDLPAGYFVMQTGEDAPDGYISVSYDDLTGLVKKSTVNAVDYIPVTKYETTVRFKCDNDGQPVNLRSAPKKTATVTKTLDPNAGGHAYGKTYGDELIHGCGNTWYYVNVDGARGYVYFAHVTVDPVPPNIIEKEEPEQPDDPVTAPAVDTNAKGMSKTAAIILIVALCIPVPFVMFYLFKKPKT